MGIICLALVGSLLYGIFSQTKPDYTIALMTSYSMPEEILSSLKKHLASYGEDLNQDGKVEVHIANYVLQSDLDTADPNMQQASFARFSGDASLGDSVIYLHEEDSFDALKDSLGGFFLYNDGSPMPEDAEDYENAMISWEEIPGLSKFQVTGLESSVASSEALQSLLKDLRVSVRNVEGASFAEKEKYQEYYQDCLELLERLKKDEPTEN